jgi:type IV pilus assembly protein PilM
MALPFLSSKERRLDQVLAIDFGSSTTKAVHVQNKGGNSALLGYRVVDAPRTSDKGVASVSTGQQLKDVVQALGSRCRQVVLTLGVGDSVVRLAEMPMMAIGDMRIILRAKSKDYLQQELTDHLFDCQILPPRGGAGVSELPKLGQKCRVLVGAGKGKVVAELQQAAKSAGLAAQMIVPSLICCSNAFELAQAQVFREEVIALVEIGFRTSTITILVQGEPAMTRVVSIGGEKLTSGLAQAMDITYEEAEGIKVGMPGEVQSHLEPLLSPLGRELRASIDFFEHQQDKSVGQVFFSGGSARSEFIVQALQAELMVPCKCWNPTAAMTLALPAPQLAELEAVAPQLAVAVGAALTAL